MQKKPALPFFSIALCLLLFLSLSCQSDEEELVELPIHRELPVLYSGVSLGEKEFTVIRSEAELQATFSESLIAEQSILKNVDFTKYSVLVGRGTYTRGIYELKHKWLMQGGKRFYRLQVLYDDTLPAGIFYYGVLVDKMEEGIEIVFDVEYSS